MRVPLEVLPGIVSDETTYAAPGFHADGDMVRFFRGRAEPIGGWSKLYDSALTGVCRNVRAWKDNIATENVAFGTNSMLYVLKSGVLYDITPTGLAAGYADTQTRETVASWGKLGWGIGPWGGGGLAQAWPRTWSLQTWGQSLMASPRGQGLYWWQNDTATPAEAVANSPNNMLAMLVTPQRQVLAFGTNEVTSGQFNPMCIRGSDIADPETWAPATSNNSFEKVLEGGGRIVGAAQFGDDILVWTDTALHYGRFTDTFDPYTFDVIATDCGLAAPNAWAIVGQTVYWLSPSLRFYVWTPGLPTQVLPCPIRNDFADNIYAYEIDKVTACQVSRFGEIWFFYPDSRDGTEVSRYVSFEPTQNAWARGKLARTAVTDRPDTYPLFVDPSSFAWEHEKGQIAVQWYIETTPAYLGEGDQKIRLSDIWPDFEDQNGDVELELYTQDYPQANKRQKGPYILKRGREKKDIRVEGRLISARFTGDGTFVRMGKPTFEATPVDGR